MVYINLWLASFVHYHAFEINNASGGIYQYSVDSYCVVLLQCLNRPPFVSLFIVNRH